MAAESWWRRPSPSVRVRTTVAAALVQALALVIAGAALMTVFSWSLIQGVDQVAEQRAKDVATLARHGTLPRSLDVTDEDVLVQVVGDKGRVTAVSANVPREGAISTLRPVGEEPVLRTVDTLPGASGQFRLLALRANAAEGRVIIYVATNLRSLDETLAQLRATLFVGTPLVLLVVSALTWVTVGRALHPVEAIRSQVAEISHHDLGLRVPVPGTQDEISRLAATMNAMLDRLQASAERQHRFVANVSHELQTPLAAVRTDLEVALAHPDAADWQDVARDLLEENRRQERLVSDLLFIARADGSAPTAAPAVIDLHELVLAETARLSVSRALRIDTTAVAPAFVLGWRDDLSRAVRNLLDNAQRYATSTISVALGTSDGTARLVIEDDGPGVPAEHWERIFERFGRVDRARSHSTGGSGLGLAIVDEIVRRHHGTVTVEDGAKGARFVVELPAD